MSIIVYYNILWKMVEGQYCNSLIFSLVAINLPLKDYLTGKEHVLHLSELAVKNSKKRQINNLFDPMILCVCLCSEFWTGPRNAQFL